MQSPANGTPSLHLYLPHLPMSRMLRFRESASDDAHREVLPGIRAEFVLAAPEFMSMPRGKTPASPGVTTLELRDVLCWVPGCLAYRGKTCVGSSGA